MKKFKQAKQLPNRAALRELHKPERTIVDYAKSTPLTPEEAPPSIIQNLRKPPRK
jgi:hypothetical protein